MPTRKNTSANKKTSQAEQIKSLQRQLSIANDALETALATSPETDNNFFSSGLSASYESRTAWDRKKIFDESMRAWRVNPLARHVVRLVTSFVIGKGITIKCDDPDTQKFLTAWWNHPLNNLNRNTRRWKDEDTRTGNLFILFNALQDGTTILRAVPAEQIVEIVTDENDIEQEKEYILDPIGNKSYPAYNPQETQEKFILHFASNQPVGSPWGEADLSPLLVWIGRYSSWLEDRVRLNRFRTAIMYRLKGKYTSEAERKARETEVNSKPPKSGSVLVENANSGEEWDIISANLDSTDANTDGLAIKKNIASGIGFPLHFLAEPESSTRTTAEAAGTPTFRLLEENQNNFFELLITCARTACKVKASVDRNIKPTAEIWIEGQDITERDNATLALALGRTYPNLIDLYDREGIEAKELLRLLYKMIAEVWDEKNTPNIKRKPLIRHDPGGSDGPTPPPDDKIDPTDPDDEGANLSAKIEAMLEKINVEPPTINVNIPEQHPIIQMPEQPAPVIKLTAPTTPPKPVIVNVKPPTVQIKNEVKLPEVTESLIVERDSDGRATRIEKKINQPNQ